MNTEHATEERVQIEAIPTAVSNIVAQSTSGATTMTDGERQSTNKALIYGNRSLPAETLSPSEQEPAESTDIVHHQIEDDEQLTSESLADLSTGNTHERAMDAGNGVSDADRDHGMGPSATGSTFSEIDKTVHVSFAATGPLVLPSSAASPSPSSPPSSSPSPSVSVSATNLLGTTRSQYYQEYEAHLHQHRRRRASRPVSTQPFSSGVVPASFSSISPYPQDTSLDSCSSSSGTHPQRVSLPGTQHTQQQYPHTLRSRAQSFTKDAPLVPPSSSGTNTSGSQCSQLIPYFSEATTTAITGHLSTSEMNPYTAQGDVGPGSEINDREDMDRRHPRLTIDDGAQHSRSSHPDSTQDSLSKRYPIGRPLSTFGAHSLPSLAPKRHTASGESVPEHSPGSSTISNEGASTSLRGDGMIGSSSGAATTSSPAATVATTSTLKTHSTRGALKGPLPIDVQIELLSNVLKHDPFNCPIRRTTQVWERIAKEHGIRARTCARRYDNIIQASIAGRERPVGTEKQIETKKKLLEQLFVMMNQPQALLRMQKKRRYRSEEADRRLLLETIRLNPFAQKVGQVVKTWEDVRDAVGMKVHSRQCIRRVNRMIKPYQIRERMYKGNIPEEMREVNDELVKQVIQLMYLGGHAASLDEDGGQSNDEDSLSGVTDSEDQGDDYTVAGAQKRNSSQDSDELEENNDGDRTIPGKIGSLRATKQKFDVGMSMDTMDTTNSPSSSSFAATAQSPSTLSSTLSSTLAFSEPSSVPSSGHATPSRRNHLCNASYGSMDRKRSATETSAARTLEEEFRPQRIWGSHPYTKETLSRSTSGSHSRKSRSSARASSAEKRDDSYMQHATVRTELAQSPASDTSYRPSLSSPTSAMSSSMVAGQEYLGYMEGTQTPMSFEQTAQIYQTILSEFRVVKEYLVRMDDQRQRDKDNQKTMYRMIERLQYQMEGQQGMIQDLQNQMQHKGSQLPYRYDSSSPSLQYRDQSPSQQSQYLRGERSLPVAEPWGHEKLRVVGELSAQDRMPLVSMVLCEQQDQCNTEMASRYESKENEENNASVH